MSVSPTNESSFVPDSHIILIGFMASGKSTLGNLLANDRKLPFVDSDAYLEQKAGVTISEIFAQKGEPHFRSLERQVILDLQRELSSPHIISTGGGLPCRNDHMDLLNQLGITVFLDPPFETLLARLLLMRADRPMLSGYSDQELREKMQALLDQRRPWYEQAQVRIPSTLPDANEAWNIICGASAGAKKT